MHKFKARRILAVLGGLVLVLGGYVGWQVYQGQQLANQYASDAQKLAQGSGSGSAASPTQAPGAEGSTPGNSPAPTTPGQTAPAGTTSPSSASSSPSSVNSSTPESPSNSSNSGDYKQLMTNTYQQTLQAMQNVKGNTLALQGRSLSFSAYRSSILQSQAIFTTAEEFARANPPTDEKLTPSYQEFLAGITLAKESMSVVLNGISSFSPSSLYAAREMGKTALQQVIEGYSHL